MRLNIACGAKKIPGFVNVDLPNNTWNVSPDIAHDCTKPLPFEDDSADELHSYHFLEHVYVWEAADILKDWYRVLKPGGLLVLELPCLDKIIGNFVAQRSGQLTIIGLYGDPKYKVPEMTHKWCYSFDYLKRGLEATGFRDIDHSKQPATHQPLRDMRFEARK